MTGLFSLHQVSISNYAICTEKYITKVQLQTNILLHLIGCFSTENFRK